jgi:hypothetical protein
MTFRKTVILAVLMFSACRAEAGGQSTGFGGQGSSFGGGNSSFTGTSSQPGSAAYWGMGNPRKMTGGFPASGLPTSNQTLGSPWPGFTYGFGFFKWPVRGGQPPVKVSERAGVSPS